jgi:hypothetical protein
MITRDYIEDIVKEGLVQDIFKMEQSYELMKTIGSKTNETKNGILQTYDELFGTIQYALQTEALLAAARIFDSPSKKYPTRCLRGVLLYLSNNTNVLPNIREPFQLSLHLKYMNAPTELISIALSGSEIFAQSFSTYVDNLLNEPDKIESLEKLKQFRDKVLAHNEKADYKIFGPTWGSLKDLIGISKNVVGVLGWAYFSIAYVINGEYILSNDTLKTSNAFNKLFKIILDKSRT